MAFLTELFRLEAIPPPLLAVQVKNLLTLFPERKNTIICKIFSKAIAIIKLLILDSFRIAKLKELLILVVL